MEPATGNSSKSFRARLRALGIQSSFHVIPHILQTEHITMLILWIVFFIVSLGFCAWTVVTNVQDFLAFRVETVVELVHSSDADFPTVTLCEYQKCAFADYEYEKYVDYFIQDTYNKSHNLTSDGKKDLLETLDTKVLLSNVYTKYLEKHDIAELERLTNFKVSMKNKIISCQYSSETCYENDFEYFQMSQFTRCYKFNSGVLFDGQLRELKKARRYGKNYGLQLEMFVGLPDGCKYPLNIAKGIVVYIHNSSHNITSDFDGIELSPGTETNIAIDRTLVRKKSEPYSNCIDVNEQDNRKSQRSGENEFIENTIANFDKYNQVKCLELCHQDYFIKEYKCFDKRFLNVDSTIQACNLSNFVFLDDSEFYTSQYFPKCREFCHSECEYMRYKITSSSAQFPSLTYKQVLVKNENISVNYPVNPSFGLVQQSVLSLNVYYKNNYYTQIRDKVSIDIDTFISNLGGVVGVFLGIYLLSFIEVFEFIVEILVELVRALYGAVCKKRVEPYETEPEDEINEIDTL